MKRILAVLMCLLSFEMHALEYDKKSENDQIYIEKAKTKADESSHEIAIVIKINGPMSPELKDFVKSIPASGNSSSFGEWKSSFINNMTQLIRLVESEKISNSCWSVKTDDRLTQEVKDS